MTWEAWLAVGVVILVIGLLALTRLAADVVLVGGVAILLLTGVLTPFEALSGMSNEGMVTVGILYIVAAGLRETGAISWLAQGVLGRPSTLARAQARLMAPVMGMSAVLNNTPVVAMFLPAVNEWARRNRLPISKLLEIQRDGEILPAIAPHQRLQAGDQLVFVGIVDSVVDLQRFRGLVPATNQVFKLEVPRPERCLIEAVVSNSCPLVGKSIREGRFRGHYNSAIIAVARNGERIERKIGDIVLKPGDTLLMEADPGFAERQHNSRDFFLVSQVPDSRPLRQNRALIAIAILVGMVLAVTLEWLPMLHAAVLAAGLLLVTRCISSGLARAAVDWQVLIAIAASFSLGLRVSSPTT